MNTTTEATRSTLSGNQLKLLALAAMTCDHVCKQLLPQFGFLSIIGRLSFPIFAYMIAEGCHYTQNRKKYLLSMAALALMCQIVYFVAMDSLYQCVLVTFSLSITVIYALDYGRRRESACAWAAAAAAVLAAVFCCLGLPRLLPGTDFHIDYGIWGVLLPAAFYLGRTKGNKLLLGGSVMILLSLSMGGIQWFSLAALPLLALYSGRRGKWKMKHLFYIYYPAHLVCIYLLSLVF